MPASPEALQTNYRPDETVVSIGRIAAQNFSPADPEASGQKPLLTPYEIDVLVLTSLGHTRNQVANHLDSDKTSVIKARKSINEKFDTKSIGFAVHKAIHGGDIDIVVTSEPAITDRLTQEDLLMLTYITFGTPDIRIARRQQKSVNEVRQHRDRVLEIVGAWSRPHAVRRAYELGIFKSTG